MRPIIYILLLSIFWSGCVSEEGVSSHPDHEECENVHQNDPECCGNCKSDCLQECEDAAACVEGQKDCGSTPNGNPFCPPNRICGTENCDCKLF